MGDRGRYSYGIISSIIHSAKVNTETLNFIINNSSPEAQLAKREREKRSARHYGTAPFPRKLLRIYYSARVFYSGDKNYYVEKFVKIYIL